MKKYFPKTLYELAPYTPGEQPSSSSPIIKLNTNENPYPPSPKILESIQDILSKGYLRKYPQPTSRTLCESIAKHFQIEPEMLLAANGSDEGIAILFRSVLTQNSKLILPWPTYSLYPVLADQLMNNTTVVYVPLKEDYHLNVEQILAQKGNLLAFASPNAPTGILESKEILCEIVSKFDGLVLVDEAYIDFASPNSSMISEVKNFPNLIVSRTFSKSYSLAGLRVGFLVSQKQNIDLLLKMKDSYNLGMLEQAIAKTAIEDVEYFQTNIQKIINSREKLKQELENLNFEVLASSANFLFAKPPYPFRAENIFTQLRDSNIYVRYFTQERCKDFLRITVGTESENEIFLSSLKSILK